MALRLLPAALTSCAHKRSLPWQTTAKGGIFINHAKNWLRPAVSGALAGAVNGFFGGGGGMVLVPLLTGWCGLGERRAFATSVAVILPLCVLSAGIYLLRGGLDLIAALPYLLGGLLGGWLGGKLFKNMSMDWLRRGFGLLLLYGGVQSLLAL